MITLPDWYKDESNLLELTKLLNNPVLEKALSLVEHANTPGFRPGVGINDLALVHAFQAGIHHVQRSLRILTMPPASGDAPAGEWEGDHIISYPRDDANPQ